MGHTPIVFLNLLSLAISLTLFATEINLIGLFPKQCRHGGWHSREWLYP